jgi:dihydrolipoamide dehydrogenase
MNETLRINSDLCIIGAGPGGYVAAIRAAKRGLDVVLCERDQIGGTCLNVGCIPTKALIHAADLFTAHKEAKSWGISYEHPELDFGLMIDKKNQIVKTLTDGIRSLLKANGVRVVEGTASFVHDRLIEVHTKSEKIWIEATNTIIATGSKTKHLSIPGLDLDGVVDSTALLEIRELPKRLVVIGGGVIGMEFAFLFARLGSQVKVLEFLPSVLPSLDKDLSQRLLVHAKRLGLSVQTQAGVERIERSADGLKVTYRIRDELQSVEADLVLEAVGRIADFTALHLEHTTIQTTGKGIVVDSNFRTSVPSIYAIGDVNGIVQLAHAASHQGMHVIDLILNETKEPALYMPNIVYTTPPIATVGLSETDCHTQGIAIRVVKVPYGANGKALILDAQTGFVKLLLDASTSKVLGAQVLGTDADHLIAPIAYLLTVGASVQAVQDAIVAHPTIEELIHEAYLGIEGLAVHYLDR